MKTAPWQKGMVMCLARRLRGVAPWLLCVALLAPLASAEAAGGKAPPFALRDLTGRQKVSLTNQNARVVIVAFWATWCSPCLKEMRHLEKLYAEFKGKGFGVIGINTDNPETRGRVKSVVRREGFSFPMAIDKNQAVANLYNPRRTLPFMVVTVDGRIVKTYEGAGSWDAAQLKQELLGLLRQ